MIKNSIKFFFTFLYAFYLKKFKVRISPTISVNSKTKFEGNNVIHPHCNILNSTIGFGTYLGPNCDLPNIEVGRFCSIAANVKVLPFNHPTQTFVSSHPSFYSTLKQAGFTYVKIQKFDETVFFNKPNYIFAHIGNDVWIGENVMIKGGLNIGDGAIIAAGSIVTKDVAPYSIVVGCPAKEIRKRFDDETVMKLLDSKWWEFSDEKLVEYSKCFQDPKIFTEKIKS
jgi:acetyltransferase-like isoleucine patch superfamily enzyme